MSSFDEKSYIKNLQVYNDETRKLFNNKNKIKRERLVVKAFLRTLGISFDDIDLTAPTEEPVDVKYRTAHFQIRELLKKERKRGDEFIKGIRIQRWPVQFIKVRDLGIAGKKKIYYRIEDKYSKPIGRGDKFVEN